MLYTTDISMTKINTKKKTDTVKKIINAGPVEYNKKLNFLYIINDIIN